MNAKSAEAFALWLAQNQPQVFQAMYEAAYRDQTLRGLHGISDWLSAVGTSIGTAAKAVGQFVTSKEGMATLGTIGGLYLQTQAQKDALKLQVANAQAGQPPAPVQSVGANPYSAVPIYVDPVTGQQQSLTPQLAQQLAPSPIQRYGPWMMIGGVLLIGLILVARK